MLFCNNRNGRQPLLNNQKTQVHVTCKQLQTDGAYTWLAIYVMPSNGQGRISVIAYQPKDMIYFGAIYKVIGYVQSNTVLFFGS